MRIHESHPLRGQSINVRCLYFSPCRVVTLNISVTEIIGIDQNNIGYAGRHHWHTKADRNRQRNGSQNVHQH